MEKLKPKTIKIKAEILTPIHIDNGEVYDRLNYFIFGEDWGEIQIIDRKWLKFCYKKDENLFKNIISTIENGNFIKLEELKLEFYEKYIEDFFEEYGIEQEIKVGEKALKHLLQEKNYSKTGKNGNNGEIKKFSRFGIDKEIFIPGSTLKGLFRTIFLNDLIEQKGLEHSSELEKSIREKKYIKNIKDKVKELFIFNGSYYFDTKKDPLNYFLFKDIKVNVDYDNLEIQFCSNFGNSTLGNSMELLISGSFDINITIFDNYTNLASDFFDINFLEDILENYSKKIYKREKENINNIKKNFDGDFHIKSFDIEEFIKQGKYPVKIGMFKREYSYKLFWEERKKINSIFLSENNEPLGWITLSDIQILDEE